MTCLKMTRTGLPYLLAIVLTFVLWVIPAHASISGNTSLIHRISEDAIVAIIPFTISNISTNFSIPALARRSADETRDPTALHYYYEDQDGDLVTKGESNAILLSDSPVVNGSYHFKAGETARLTIFAALTPSHSTGAIRVRLQTLPFHLDSKGNQQFNKHELGKIKTEYLSLRKESKE